MSVESPVTPRHWFIGCGCLILLVVLAFGSSVVMYGCSYIGRVAKVAGEETDPAVLLKKYSWFKDASASLDKKQADIKVYGVRIKELEKAYQGKPRNEWPRDDRQEHSQLKAELLGIKASYNGLAAEYNAAMVKIQFKFCNVGDLPPGATAPLPREYKPYQED